MIIRDTAMRNPNAKHIDFSELRWVIPDNPRFLPSNIDMVLERHSQFFIGEWKRPNEQISKGQLILLNKLSEIPNFSVYIITGDTDNGMNVENIEKLEKGAFIPSGKDLKKLIQDWYKLTYRANFG